MVTIFNNVDSFNFLIMLSVAASLKERVKIGDNTKMIKFLYTFMRIIA